MRECKREDFGKKSDAANIFNAYTKLNIVCPDINENNDFIL